jgi:hypothetical protein
MGRSRYSVRPLQLDGISTYPLDSRPSKVSTDLFAQPVSETDTVSAFVAKLPRILAAEGLRDLVTAIALAHRDERTLLWGMGGHVVKCGLGPLIIDMMDDGLVSGIAMNGAALIHDFEIALKGSTSEEVDDQLASGRFGMAQETGEYLNRAVNDGHASGLGVGESVGAFLANATTGIHFEHLEVSIVHAAYLRSIPVTIHVAIGADITHIHPDASGESLGGASMTDFRLLCALVRDLQHGVYVNMGSAVILPEVFLKAVSVVRNLGATLDDLTTANLDFIQHYRPTQNVLKRPTLNGGRSIAITGHHEIMIPLLAAALKGSLKDL